MKRIIRILVLAITLVTGLMTISAQNVQVLLTQKVPALPATAISYLAGPFHFFNTQFIVTGAGSEGLDIFFDMEMTVNTSPLYVRTRPGSIPMQPIHLSEGVNIMSDEDLIHIQPHLPLGLVPRLRSAILVPLPSLYLPWQVLR